MSESDTLGYLGLLILLLFSAFFSGSETALIGSRRLTLTTEAQKGSRSADRALKLIREPGSLLGTILVGNNLVNVAAAALGAYLWGPLTATIVVTLLLLLFGEIPPKTIATYWPESIAKAVSWPISLFKRLFWPMAWVAQSITDLIMRPLFRKVGPRRGHFSQDEISTALGLSQAEGELEPGEARMAQETLELDKTLLEEIMIPLGEIATLHRHWNLDQVMREIRRSRFTRYPVYDKSGVPMNRMLHIKDLVLATQRENWCRLTRPLQVRPGDMPADDLLREMQIGRFHMCAVAREDGEIEGYVTMECVLEEIVGEIADEHDKEDDPVKTLGDDKYLVRGDLEVADVQLILNIDLEAEDPEQTLDAYYRERAGGRPFSYITVGRARIRAAKKKFVFELFEDEEALEEEIEEERNGSNHAR